MIEPYNEDPVKYKELYNYTEVLCALTIVGWVSEAKGYPLTKGWRKKNILWVCVWLGYWPNPYTNFNKILHTSSLAQNLSQVC